MKDFIMIALAESEDELFELQYIYKIASTGFKYMHLKEFTENRKKDNISISPKNKKPKENLKGYDINAK